MNNKKELTILFWMTAIFAVIFFMPLGNERFMTALDATLDLPNGMRKNTWCYACSPHSSSQESLLYSSARERYSNTSGQTPRNGYPTRLPPSPVES